MGNSGSFVFFSFASDNLCGYFVDLVDYTPPDGAKRQALAQVSSPVRRTAIDFLGRGFPLWEPYLDTAHLLNSLLSLIAGEVGRLAEYVSALTFILSNAYVDCVTAY